MEEEQVVSGKLGRQIMNMAREQQEALEDGEDGGGDSDDDDDEDTMQWRESQMYFFIWGQEIDGRNEEMEDSDDYTDEEEYDEEYDAEEIAVSTPFWVLG